MTLSPSKVVAGKGKPGGYAFRAPAGTALPTDATTALSPAFVSQGLVSSDGLSRAITRAYEIIRDWNGDEVKRVKTETSVTITFVLIEAANAETWEAVFGEDAVTVNGDTITLSYAGEETEPEVWVFELADGPHAGRIVAALAQNVTEDFTQEFTASSVISMPITLALYKPAGGSYFDHHQTVVAADDESGES